MKRILTYILVLLVTSLSIDAKYVLYSFSGGITIKQSNRDVKPEKGMELNASDEITIPKGAKVEIYNTVTKEIFTSVTSGMKSVMGIMLDARKQAEKTTGAINDRMRFSANGNQNNSSRLYTEGLVKRSMQVYDPEAQNLIVEPEVLALHILNALRAAGQDGAADFPTALTHNRLGDSGLEFKIENSLSFPIYVNLIKINETQLGSIEISELGQPMGCYVLLPGQTLSRQHFAGLASTDSHYLVMTHCRFDIDELIASVNSLLSQHTDKTPDAQLPVYITRL